MGAISPKEAGLDNSIEVIVQYTKEGKIVPMRMKIQDEDGMYQSYVIRQFREKTITGLDLKEMNISSTDNKNKCYEVKINVFNVERVIKLFFDGNKWYMR